jgi:serine/threonine protein kinase
MTDDNATIIVKSFDLAGKQFGNYQVLGELGRGGMAIVYKADEQSLNRVVALKVLSPKISEDETMIKRFHREAQAAARLNHPNIVHIYSIGEQDGINYFAMEYIKGKTLKEWQQECGKLTAAQALPAIIQTAEALGEAHKVGLVHRDIKPSNIMIDPAGRAVVTDFGIARVCRSTVTQLTTDGQFLGTPQYMSPEQCEASDIDGRSDIYSLGVTFYEVLAGQNPYQAETPASTIVKVMQGQYQPIRELDASIPKSVQQVLDKMLSKDKEDRYTDANELIQALRTLELEVAGDDATLLETAATSATSENVHINWLVPGMVASAVLLIVGALWIVSWLRGSSDADDTAGEQTTVAVANTAPTPPSPAPAAAQASVALPTPSTPVQPIAPAKSVTTPSVPALPISTPVVVSPAVIATPKAAAQPATPPPPAKSVLVTATGDDDKADLVTAYAQGTITDSDFQVVDSSAVGGRQISTVAARQVVIKINKLGSTTLNYMGQSTEQTTVTLTMRISSTATGSMVAGPVMQTVKYTAFNADKNLKEAVEELTEELLGKLK